ncbi:MAG: RIO1 family regulatory kinase/ATPase [Anaerolineae bacterium]|nr:RIO1 family regulatory kinase/ATPase [Anaerolineae bacterium]
MQDNSDFDKFEQYEDIYDPVNTDRKARRKRKPRVNHKPKKTDEQVVQEIADAIGLEGGFETTYQPARYEKEWLLGSVEPFYIDELISDVLAQIKGGKEANVYRCRATPGTGHELLALKVYRPRKFRNLRNDKMYREGRQVLAPTGRPLDPKDERILRALGKKTSFGVQVQHTSWLMHEFTALDLLYKAGGSVPKPIAAAENAILMSYIGDEYSPAPTLNEIDLDPAEAEPLFREALRNVELLLQHGLIHGDLSAYNILYWEGKITLIDFPQVVDYRTNPNAEFILKRDITRVCDYFADQGVECDAETISQDLWDRYAAPDEEDLAADASRPIDGMIP